MENIIIIDYNIDREHLRPTGTLSCPQINVKLGQNFM